MKYLVAAAVALAIGGAAPAHAALVTFDFSAVQNGFVGDVPIPNGAAFDGSLTIDTSVAGTGGFPTGVQYAGAFKSIDFSGEVIDVSGWAVNEVTVSAFSGFGFGTQHGRIFDFFAQNNGASIHLFLGSSDSSLDPLELLPTTLPDFSVFDSGHLLLFADASGSASDLVSDPGGAVNAVPEPSGGALLASSVLMLGLLALGIKRKGSALAA